MGGASRRFPSPAVRRGGLLLVGGTTGGTASPGGTRIVSRDGHASSRVLRSARRRRRGRSGRDRVRGRAPRAASRRSGRRPTSCSRRSPRRRSGPTSAAFARFRTYRYDHQNQAARIASGSFLTRGWSSRPATQRRCVRSSGASRPTSSSGRRTSRSRNRGALVIGPSRRPSRRPTTPRDSQGSRVAVVVPLEGGVDEDAEAARRSAPRRGVALNVLARASPFSPPADPGVLDAEAVERPADGVVDHVVEGLELRVERGERRRDDRSGTRREQHVFQVDDRERRFPHEQHEPAGRPGGARRPRAWIRLSVSPWATAASVRMLHGAITIPAVAKSGLPGGASRSASSWTTVARAWISRSGMSVSVLIVTSAQRLTTRCVSTSSSRRASRSRMPYDRPGCAGHRHDDGQRRRGGGASHPRPARAASRRGGARSTRGSRAARCRSARGSRR